VSIKNTRPLSLAYVLVHLALALMTRAPSDTPSDPLSQLNRAATPSNALPLPLALQYAPIALSPSNMTPATLPHSNAVLPHSPFIEHGPKGDANAKARVHPTRYAVKVVGDDRRLHVRSLPHFISLFNAFFGFGILISALEHP
jgi:hypothetical protein